ncbi:MAG: hypothetical protein D6731_14445 [Planctomycetota bacterium]|nr:MAG: hypothetical protein D6731_14445 [Planctomycetota bacterium]
MNERASPPDARPAAAESDSADEASPPAGMVLVPAGPFLFSRRKVEVPLGAFWIDLHPVTNGDYEAFVAEFRLQPPLHWPPGGLTNAERDLPLVRVTYAEAERYATLTGKALPTPAQFEKAARGTDGRKYPWGDEVRGRAANTREAGIGRLTPVDAFPQGASPYGCLDMAGNVLHWTRGVYDEARGTRVVMGSSFRRFLGACSWYYEEDPEVRHDDLGFRCVWTPPKDESPA